MQLFSIFLLTLLFSLTASTTIGGDQDWNLIPNLPAGEVICETKADAENYVRNDWDYMQKPGCGKTLVPLLVRITVEPYKIDGRVYQLRSYQLFYTNVILVTVYSIQKK